MPRITLTIGRKLALVFGLVVLLTLIALAAALSGTAKLRDSTTTVGTRVVPATHLLGEATTEIRQFRVAQLERTLASDPADQKDLDGELTATATTVDGILARLGRYAATPGEVAALRSTKADWLTYRRASGAFASAASRGGTVAGYAVLSGKADGVYDSLKTDVARASALTSARGDAQVKASQDDAASTRRTMVIVLLAELLAAIAAGVLLTRSIRRSVGVVLDRLSTLRDHCAANLNAGLHAFAEGDLTRDVVAVTELIPSPGGDEIGDIARATNDIRDNFVATIDSYNSSRAALADLVSQVAGTASAVSSASQQMATTSDEAGRAVGEIAGAIGEAAAGAERQVASIAEARRIADDVVAVTGRS
ncbi:MAG: methyl-accepting chemotaxis protein, partial [Conexibacter sp.]|nr:methyl-accepting chemotaxis protein [Conexibacter sp.]